MLLLPGLFQTPIQRQATTVMKTDGVFNMNSLSLHTSTYGYTGAVVPSPRIIDELTRLSALIFLSLSFFF